MSSIVVPRLPPDLLLRYGPSKKWRLLRWTGFVALIVLLAAWQAEVDLVSLVLNLPEGLQRGQGFFKPDWSAMPELLRPALVTVLLAAIPTPIGIALAIPLAFLAAKNIVPIPVRMAVRAFITLQRGIPEIVIMVLLAAAFGLGPYPAIVAIVLGSVGMLAKLIADAIEEVDEKPLESLACTGAHKWQIVRYGILPAIMPVIIANSIFRFEINMRQAGLLGAVGAGGLGYELSAAMLATEYERAMSVILMSLLLVFVAEKLSDQLRRRVLDGASSA
ncbi:MAG: phosphonate ABC transporter, permease protein PhnE [Panacagrimonas sp.]